MRLEIRLKNLGEYMNWMSELQNLNYLAVAVATIASYFLGFAWYHWAAFGEAWANALGMSKEEADNTEGLGGAFIMSLISGLTKAVLMALLIAVINITGVLSGALLGALIASVFTITSLGYYNGFARTSSQLTFINSAHSIAELALIGAIIAAFT
jgi:flagellar biosynthesis protein FlhB